MYKLKERGKRKYKYSKNKIKNRRFLKDEIK